MSADVEVKKALARAYRLLAVRPRSEEEVRHSLARSGFGEAAREEAITTLLAQGLLNDRSFALEWTRSRVESRPRSRRLIERELKAKGVSSEDIEAATSELDDDALALQVVSRRLRFVDNLDRQTCLRRLSQYLLSRGFTGETVTRAVTAALSSREDSKHEEEHDKLQR